MSGSDDDSTLKLDKGVKIEKALHLRVYTDAGVISQRLPDAGRLRIGRAPTNDLVVDDVSISRQHAVVHVGTRIEIEDVGSANGTVVRQRALLPGERVAITKGEQFEIGALTAVLKMSATVSTGATEARPSRDVTPSTVAVVSQSGPMREVIATIQRLAVGTISVLLFGETGVGKELLAEQIHLASPRAGKPFLRINCGALSETLLESELFGHEKGAFTGAAATKVGLLESANGSTVFLDEVGELPSGLQVKLLRVLENREVMRVGAVRPRPLDVRFIAATNRDLEQACAEGRFRQDLYFRLNGATVNIPPLRERTEEIVPLATNFIARAATELGRPVPVLADATRTALLAYNWPGNVRELRNAIERAVLLCDDVIEPRHLPPRMLARDEKANSQAAATPPSAPRPADSAADLERRRIVDALEKCAGSQSRAALLLGISRSTLLARIDQYGIPRPRKQAREE